MWKDVHRYRFVMNPVVSCLVCEEKVINKECLVKTSIVFSSLERREIPYSKKHPKFSLWSDGEPPQSIPKKKNKPVVPTSTCNLSRVLIVCQMPVRSCSVFGDIRVVLLTSDESHMYLVGKPIIRGGMFICCMCVSEPITKLITAIKLRRKWPLSHCYFSAVPVADDLRGRAEHSSAPYP